MALSRPFFIFNLDKNPNFPKSDTGKSTDTFFYRKVFATFFDFFKTTDYL